MLVTPLQLVRSTPPRERRQRARAAPREGDRPPEAAVREVAPVSARRSRSTGPDRARARGARRRHRARRDGGGRLRRVPYSVAGKTGTGEVSGYQDTAWFASFAPAEAPEFAVVVMVSEGGTGGRWRRRRCARSRRASTAPGGLPGGRLPPLPDVRPDRAGRRPCSAAPPRRRAAWPSATRSPLAAAAAGLGAWCSRSRALSVSAPCWSGRPRASHARRRPDPQAFLKRT